MTADAVIRAFGLPTATQVHTRVPRDEVAKTLTGNDRRVLVQSLRGLTWVATLRPENIAVPAYSDDVRAYGEIVVLHAKLGPGASAARLATLVHRAVKYPTVLVSEGDHGVALSLAHVRRHERKDDVVVDGDVRVVLVRDEPIDRAFLAGLPVSSGQTTHLHALYGGWVERAEALLAARLTGAFVSPAGPEAAAQRRQWYQELVALDAQIDAEGNRAAKERSLAARVALNDAIAALRTRRTRLVDLLTAS